jgi:hypothetical protein
MRCFDGMTKQTCYIYDSMFISLCQTCYLLIVLYAHLFTFTGIFLHPA